MIAEAVTHKTSLRRMLADCDGYLKDASNMGKKKLRKTLEQVRAALRKTWKELGEDAGAEESEPGQRALDFGQGGTMNENFLVDFTELKERAVSERGMARIKLIAPGQGSSGFYPREVLQRDGPKVFRAGTQMFWNHPTDREEFERPEGDLDDLAAVLVSDAKFENGAAGEGLYSDAVVFSKFTGPVNELAPHIGVSIRGKAVFEDTTVNGAPVRMIKELISAKSVDFVTKPGAGGKIIEAFEAARNGAPPAARAGAANPSAQPAGQQEVNEVTEEEAKALEGKLEKLIERADALEAENKRLREAEETRAAREREAGILRQARAVAEAKIAEAELPDVTKRRLAESLATNPPVKDGALDQEALESRIASAIESEKSYIATITGSGTVRGMGGGAVFESDKAPERIETAFTRMGMSADDAKRAATGRVQ